MGAIARLSERHPQDGPHVDLRLRVEPKRFVAEISMNLTFLDWMLEVPREDPERIDPVELARLAPRLEAYFAAQMPVRIDGVPAVPVLRDLAANDPDEALLPLFPLSGWRGLRKISFALDYRLGDAPPDDVSLVWPAYPPDLLSVLPEKPPLEIAAEWTAEGLRSQVLFRRSEPGFTWHRPIGGIEARLERVPLPPPPRPLVPAWATIAVLAFALGFGASAAGRRGPRFALLAGLASAASVLAIRPAGPPFLAFGTRAAAAVDRREAASTFEALQANLYRAFDYESEAAVYDALSRSVEGELLEETYLSVRRALVMEEEGGAVSRVVEVRPMRTEIESEGAVDGPEGPRQAFVVSATWQVDGRVTHWGHAHDRTNEYDGRFTVAATREGWRIHDAEITRQERIQERIDAPDGADGAGAGRNSPPPEVPPEEEEL